MRSYVVASVLTILGLVFLVWGGNLESEAWPKPYISELASALLVGGMLSLLFKIFQERESETKLRRLFRVHDSVDELGLVEILPEVQAFSFSEMIEKSDTLSVIMNDGQRWIGNNTVSLSKRFARKSTIEFFTVDPESVFVDTLSKKTSCSSEEIKRKIEDSWRKIEEAYNRSERKGRFVIYAIDTFPTRSIFLTEDMLVETPYQTAAGRARIPVFVYRKVCHSDSPYNFALNDIAQLRSEAREVKRVGY